MGEFLDPVALNFVCVTSVIALVVALTDLLLIQLNKGKVHLVGLKSAIDSVLVIAGFMAFVGTCIVIADMYWNFAATETFWKTIEFTTIVDQQKNLKVLLSPSVSITMTWFLSTVFFEIWCLLRFLYRRHVRRANHRITLMTGADNRA